MKMALKAWRREVSDGCACSNAGPTLTKIGPSNRPLDGSSGSNSPSGYKNVGHECAVTRKSG